MASMHITTLSWIFSQKKVYCNCIRNKQQEKGDKSILQYINLPKLYFHLRVKIR